MTTITLTLSITNLIIAITVLFFFVYVLRLIIIFSVTKHVYIDCAEDIDPEFIAHQLERIEFEFKAFQIEGGEMGGEINYRVNMLVGLNSEFATGLAELCNYYQFSRLESIDYSISSYNIKFVKL